MFRKREIDKINVNNEGKSIGIDLGLTDLAIYSDGQKFPILQSLRKNLNKCFNKSNANINPILEFETEELIIDAARRNLGVGYVVKTAIQYLVDANILEKKCTLVDTLEIIISILLVDFSSFISAPTI